MMSFFGVGIVRIKYRTVHVDPSNIE